MIHEENTFLQYLVEGLTMQPLKTFTNRLNLPGFSEQIPQIMLLFR